MRKVEETPKDDLLLGYEDNEVFNLLDGADCDTDFISSLSSSSSQIDYDKMAIDAMEEVLLNNESVNDKANNLHDYSNSNKWTDGYNKGMSKIKTDDIDVIEEDIENEIDSDYSMTLRKGQGNRLLAGIRHEFTAEEAINLLNSSKDLDSEFTNTLESEKLDLSICEQRIPNILRRGSVN